MTDQPSLPLEEFEIFIEWPDEEYGRRKASLKDNLKKMQDESTRAINLALGAMRSMAYRISREIDEIEDGARPDEVEVEFGLKLELETGVDGGVVPFVAKTTTGGQFNIKFKWNIEKQNQAHVLIDHTC